VSQVRSEKVATEDRAALASVLARAALPGLLTLGLIAGAVVVGTGVIDAEDHSSSAATERAGRGSIDARVGFGVFYVNGEQHPSNWSDNRQSGGKLPTKGLTTTYHQARITYLIPEVATGPNIVLVPGYGLSSDIYMTTPDQRQGWAQSLYRQGYPVYIVSPPDRGESMPVDKINKCKAGKAPKEDCEGRKPRAYYGQIGHATLEPSWRTWRFGPEYGVPYANSQFPSLPLKENYVEQFGASFVPYLGTSDIDMVDNTVMNDLSADAITALLEDIGPSIIVLHSAAGTAGYQVAEDSPDLVEGLVAIETTKCPPNVQGRSPLAGMPFLGIWGDHITKTTPGGHWMRRDSCVRMARAIDRSGLAPAEVISLPDDLGIRGNSHMMMQDLNNLVILDVITEWWLANGA
jgi:pimeloyl-ACP methyl ester carboxylesterase